MDAAHADMTRRERQCHPNRNWIENGSRYKRYFVVFVAEFPLLCYVGIFVRTPRKQTLMNDCSVCFVHFRYVLCCVVRVMIRLWRVRMVLVLHIRSDAEYDTTSRIYCIYCKSLNVILVCDCLHDVCAGTLYEIHTNCEWTAYNVWWVPNQVQSPCPCVLVFVMLGKFYTKKPWGTTIPAQFWSPGSLRYLCSHKHIILLLCCVFLSVTDSVHKFRV